MSNENSKWYKKGLIDGIPIAIGYFVVSFALGIAAKKAGFQPWQAAIMSCCMLASAGEFAVVTIVAASGGYIQMFLATVVINLRYLLMSCSLSQKLKPDEKLFHRFLLAYSVTDEIFGIASNVPGRLNPFYNYGATLLPVIGWTSGTFLGCAIGSILPTWLESALGVALYGMFLAIVIPEAKKDKTVGIFVIISFVASFAFSKIPVLCNLSSGMRIIILTIAISAIAALIRPIDDEPSTEGQVATEPDQCELSQSANSVINTEGQVAAAPAQCELSQSEKSVINSEEQDAAHSGKSTTAAETAIVANDSAPEQNAQGESNE